MKLLDKKAVLLTALFQSIFSENQSILYWLGLLADQTKFGRCGTLDERRP